MVFKLVVFKLLQTAGIMGVCHHNQLPKILFIYGWSDLGDKKIHPKGGLALLGTGLAHCAVTDLSNPSNGLCQGKWGKASQGGLRNGVLQSSCLLLGFRARTWAQ